MRLGACLAVIALLFAAPAAKAQTPVPLSSGCGSGSIINGQGYPTEDTLGRGCVAVGPSTSGWYTYSNITTDTTTSVKSGAGVLHTITFNNPVATEVVTIYDNTAASGTKIGTITVPASPQPVTLTYDVAFNTGLTVVTATAASDVTLSYK